MSLSTIQGFVYNKPHGYAGDFEVIDRIYNYHIAEPKHLSKWDTFFIHSMELMQSVIEKPIFTNY